MFLKIKKLTFRNQEGHNATQNVEYEFPGYRTELSSRKLIILKCTDVYNLVKFQFFHK